MISNVRFAYSNGALISYEKDGHKCEIPYSLIKEKWNSLTLDSIEGGKCKIIGDLIVFSVIVAEGQGGVLFVWNATTNDFVHYSDASYCEDFIIVEHKVILLKLVSNFVTPYHIQVWSCAFGTKSIWEEGKRLCCKNPTSFESSDAGKNAFSLNCRDKALNIIVGSRSYLYSDDIDCIENQTPNPNYCDLYKEPEEKTESEKLLLRGMIT